MSDDMAPDEIPQDWQDKAPDAPPAAAGDGTPAPSAPEPEPCLPDGFALSVEDVRALLAQKHDTAVPVDDPMLMMVTIQNAFLEAQSQLQKRHEKALAAFMSKQTEIYIQGVEKSVGELQKTLSDVTINGIRDAASDFAATLTSFKTTLFICTAIMGLSALLNVAVFVLKAVQHG